ncbi:PfaD family polyunsaturated fatty acid/polyketide biosynthesis protein [Roseomonas sp. 18066]|uniref:PfaD family polyunsaturated fatty acid/polyketide biosynthesis protein n=1 Tax=Roseomonas sp. 18066 TaxID=2681412 RepID=UPI00190F567F|nr:PfaD family polyunsaturated fatty acid/polyketide biosynthesis protein [Roseomonas sp. 18066]
MTNWLAATPSPAAPSGVPAAASPFPDGASLGDPGFQAAHGVRLNYVVGAMVKAIASEPMLEALARRGLLGFFGAGGCTLPRIAEAIDRLQSTLPPTAPWGVNFLHNFVLPAQEEALTDLLLARRVTRIEASAFVQVTPALLRYRLTGLTRAADGQVTARHRLLAKLSRPEVARQFLAPAPAAMVAELAAAGRITPDEARLAAEIPLADDICAEADSGGHTDRRVAFTLVPHIASLRDELAAEHRLRQRVRIGAAGGLGTPQAIAAAFVLGADFVMTGSINQCTPEAGTSDAVKDLLARADLADTDMAPAGDMFEIGAKVQVLRRGTLFPGRAQRLYELYTRHDSLDDIPAATLAEIENRWFGRSIDAVWQETASYYRRAAPQELATAEANPKKRMAMVFRWYFIHTNRLAIDGDPSQRVNFQIHCGPAMGALNRWLKGTPLEDWKQRNVATLAEKLMHGAAETLNDMLRPRGSAPWTPAGGIEFPRAPSF